jgi:predicted SnoaL-like aldol condensation-catalyzing enzyme
MTTATAITLMTGFFLCLAAGPLHADQTTSGDLGAMARQAMMSIFGDRNASAVDRYFAEPFIQHDPNVADGLGGLRAFVADVAKSPTTGITIYRTLVDNDIVMLHSRYEGMPGFSGPVIAFDLFRFKNEKIVEHWGGQEAEAGLNPSGRSQVDGPTEVVDRDKTETNRALVRNFKQVVTVDLHFERVNAFIDDNRYFQHASKVGDGIARLKSRVSEVAKPSTAPVLIPRRYVADGNFVLAVVEARTERPTTNYDLFRVENGRIVEHWDVLSAIPPLDRRKNKNEPF